MLKKIMALLLALCLLFCLTACGNGDTNSNTSGDVSQIQSTTDTLSENETTNSETSSTESGTENTTSTPTNSETSATTSKPTESSKPANTSKPTTSTTPSTSKPSTETSKPTETHTHSWGNWRIETKALVGKDGTEKRTCSSCKETETRSTTKDAIFNSFFNEYLQEYFVWCVMNGSNPTPFDTSALFKCGDLIARDLCYHGTPEDIATSTIPVNDYYNALKQYFVLSDNVINQMKAARSGNAYPVTYDGFTPGPMYETVGYIHNGGNKYTVYYDAIGDYQGQVNPIKVELEYNLLNNKPNRYISIEKVNSIPSNITK